ncbi:Sirt6 [Symbiodinium sp. CCMP2592]|nr:Sirt6 [Symbiodinium sp. CCMP2592]
MDTLCKASGGVRVHGDCDEFMHHVMLALLGEEQFKDWEASLSEKHARYASQRPTVGKQRGDIFAAWLDILSLDSASCSISSSEPACFEHRGQESLIFLLLGVMTS